MSILVSLHLETKETHHLLVCRISFIHKKGKYVQINQFNEHISQLMNIFLSWEKDNSVLHNRTEVFQYKFI